MKPSDDLTDTKIRGRLIAIIEEQNALASDDFAGKHKLAVEADALRKALNDLVRDDLAEASSQWAGRAGHKNTHDDGLGAIEPGLRVPVTPNESP